jgi:hybrid cluster-associated redox disulfide protein
MEHPRLKSDLSVCEVMERWPQTIPTFFRHRMACVGCPIAHLATLADVAAIYDLDLARFLLELQQTAELEHTLELGE